MAEYLTYPFKTMRITQTYNGTTSHKPHTTGNLKDFPIDEGGKDGGRDPMYAPCDLIVKRIYGVGTGGTNTVWFESVNKVITPVATDYICGQATHSNDSDLKRLKVGQTVKKGEILCYEGTDGATGNHIHLSIALGKLEGNGWKQNSNGKWVLTGTGKELKPEEAFFVDPSFTKIMSSNGLKFKEIPATNPKEKTATTAKKAEATVKYTKGNYKVTADLLNVRAGAGTTYAVKTFTQFTADAQQKIKKLNNGKPANGYVKGLTFTVSEVKNDFGKTPSGWVCLDYCEKIK